MMVEFPSAFRIWDFGICPKVDYRTWHTNFLELRGGETHKNKQDYPAVVGCQTAPRLDALYPYSSLQSSLISISDSDSEVSKFIKYMHKGRLPSNLEPGTPPPSYEGRKQLVKAIHFLPYVTMITHVI